MWSPPLSRRAVRLERILHAAGITQVPQPMTFPLAPGRPLPRQLHPPILTYTIADDGGLVTGEAQLLFARPGDGSTAPKKPGKPGWNATSTPSRGAATHQNPPPHPSNHLNQWENPRP